MIYCNRMKRAIGFHLFLVMVGFLLSIALFSVSAYSQTEVLTGAGKIADLAHDKSVVWLALVALIVTIGYAGLLTRVLIQMATKFLEASVKNAEADALMAKAHDDQSKAIDRLGINVNDLKRDLDARPCAAIYQQRPPVGLHQNQG